jgi:hypothetical protein
MYTQDRDPVINARIPWYEAIDNPGTFHMQHVKKLFLSRPFEKLVPNQKMIVDGPVAAGAKIKAAMADDGSYAYIYSPRGEQFSIDKTRLKGKGSGNRGMTPGMDWNIQFIPRSHGAFRPIHHPPVEEGMIGS